MNKILLKIIAVLMLAFVALICLLLAYVEYKKATEIEAWQQLTAVVASATVEESKRRKGITYCPRISVAFSLGEQAYTSKLEVSEGPCNPIREIAERTAANLAVGNSVEVFVNPAKPSEVRLGTYSLGPIFYITAIVGIMVLVGAAVLMFSSANKPSEPTR